MGNDFFKLEGWQLSFYQTWGGKSVWPNSYMPSPVFHLQIKNTVRNAPKYLPIALPLLSFVQIRAHPHETDNWCTNAHNKWNTNFDTDNKCISTYVLYCSIWRTRTRLSYWSSNLIFGRRLCFCQLHPTDHGFSNFLVHTSFIAKGI